MSRKYKMNNLEGIYFVSFATVYWIDVFVREIYFEKIIQDLAFCCKEKRMILLGIVLCRAIFIYYSKRRKKSYGIIAEF